MSGPERFPETPSARRGDGSDCVVHRTGLAAITTANDRTRRSDRRLVLIRGREQVIRLINLVDSGGQLKSTALPQINAAARTTLASVPMGTSAISRNGEGELPQSAALLLPALAQLPRLERQILTLRLLEHIDTVDIARYLNRSEREVTRLSRQATVRLRAVLDLHRQPVAR
jgi:DNA-directed RNA polymerase specialized sigma24 family protein